MMKREKIKKRKKKKKINLNYYISNYKLQMMKKIILRIKLKN